MKRQLTKQQLILFGLPVVGLMLGLLGYLALVSPQKSHAGRLASEIGAAQAQLLAAHKPAVKAKPTSAQAADLFRLTKAMPDSGDMSGVLRQLTLLAHASSVSLDTVRPSPVVTTALGYGAIPMEVDVSGKFANVVGFLQRVRQQVAIGKKGRLHADGRLFVANQIQLTTTDGRSVAAAMKFDAFVYGAPPTPTAPAAGVAAGTTTTSSASGH